MKISIKSNIGATILSAAVGLAVMQPTESKAYAYNDNNYSYYSYYADLANTYYYYYGYNTYVTYYYGFALPYYYYYQAGYYADLYAWYDPNGGHEYGTGPYYTSLYNSYGDYYWNNY